jgi:hypothetical protein
MDVVPTIMSYILCNALIQYILLHIQTIGEGGLYEMIVVTNALSCCHHLVV